MLTIKETAAALNLSYRTVFNYIKKGDIKAVRIGRKWLVKEEEVERLRNEGMK